MTLLLGEVTLRVGLGATLAVISALGTLAAGSQVANASTTDTFTVVSAGATAGNPDQLTVVVDSPSTLNSLEAPLSDGSSSSPYPLDLALSSTEVDPSDSSQTQTTWTASIAAGSVSGLPLGSYTVSLTGTFADSTQYIQSDVGSFNFFATSRVGLQASPDLLTSAGSTALTGQLILSNPDGSVDTDYPTGASVTIQSDDGTTLATLPLASDGSYSDPDFPVSASENIEAVFAGTATIGSGVSEPVALTVDTPPPSGTLKVNPVTETYGKAVAVTGTLTSGSTPLAGQTVWVGTTGFSDTPLATGTTSASGAFSVTLPEQAAGGTLYVGATDSSGASEATTVQVALKVVHPTTISSFKTTLNQYWGLSVSGCLGFPASDKTEKITRTSGLTVEYASAGGSWKKLATINANEADHACGTGGIEFTGSYTAPENYADYRVVYAGTTGATSFAATNGNSVLAWRYDDRITDYKISPTTVNAGGKLTISGVLQYWYSGWHNYSGQTIVIYLHPKSSNPTWYWLVKIKTNAKGQFSTTFKDPVSATWQAAFEGNNSNGVGHLTAGSPEVYVRLK
jgi:hypothetical protein